MTNTNHTQIIIQACTDATGGAPSEHKILSKLEKWLRFPVSDDRKGTKSGAVKVMDKGNYYVYIVKDHRAGITKTGSTRTGKASLMTPEEKQLAAQQRREMARLEQERSERKHKMLSAMARRIWAGCSKPEECTKSHPYIVKKGVQPLNIKRYKSHKKDVLVLPMVDPLQGLRSLYLVYPNGFKRPLKGTQFKGLCMAIGRDLSSARIIWVVEGWATGVSLHQLTGEHVVVAFSAGNLEPVIDRLITKYPDAEVKLCADDDQKTLLKTGKNPGIEYAQQVQKKHPQISLYKPIFPAGAPEGLSDINDLMNWQREQGGQSNE